MKIHPHTQAECKDFSFPLWQTGLQQMVMVSQGRVMPLILIHSLRSQYIITAFIVQFSSLKPYSVLNEQLSQLFFIFCRILFFLWTPKITSRRKINLKSKHQFELNPDSCDIKKKNTHLFLCLVCPTVSVLGTAKCGQDLLQLNQTTECVIKTFLSESSAAAANPSKLYPQPAKCTASDLYRMEEGTNVERRHFITLTRYICPHHLIPTQSTISWCKHDLSIPE